MHAWKTFSVWKSNVMWLMDCLQNHKLYLELQGEKHNIDINIPNYSDIVPLISLACSFSYC